MKISDLSSADASSLKEHYTKFEQSEQEAILQRNKLLRSMASASIQQSAQSGKSLTERTVRQCPADELQLKNLEAKSGAFRYAQYIVLGKHLSNSPPLETRTIHCLPARAEIIKRYTEYRGIEYLVHYTQTKNIESILKNGLLSRTKINEAKLNVAINDENRLDKCLNGISASISFPNGKCFYSTRASASRDKNVPISSWAVLLIDKAVLWEKDCLFNYFNAADRAMRARSHDERQTFFAYEGMFEDIQGPNSREKQRLEAHHPTNVQAEVLIIDNIEKEYIKKIRFNEDKDLDKYYNLMNDIEFSVEKYGMFGQREWTLQSKSQ